MRNTPRDLAAAALVSLALAGCGGDQTAPAAGPPQGPSARQLTHNDDIFEANPIVSPDGTWILFESDRTGNMDIWRMPAGGGESEQLTRDPGFDSSPYWAPDGQAVVFESDRSGTKNLWVLDLASREPPMALTSGPWDDGSPAWSPDGAYVVFESNRDRLAGTDLWLVEVAGGVARRLTETPVGTYHRSADWSPDGAQVVFESNREGGLSALYTMGVSGGVVRRITALPGYEGHPAWSPDGTRIAFESDVTGTMQIHLVATVGGKTATATRSGGFWPRWSPDGRSLVFGVYGNPQPNIWRVDLD